MQQEIGFAGVYVTHDQDEAMAISDRIVVMNEGKVLQVGTPREIYRRPSSRFVASFIGIANVWEGRLGATGDGGSRTVAVRSRRGDDRRVAGGRRAGRGGASSSWRGPRR